MVKNMGSIDKIIRILLAVVAAVLIFTGIISETAAVVIGILGFGFLLTSIIGTCPLYIPFKINTGSKEE